MVVRVLKIVPLPANLLILHRARRDFGVTAAIMASIAVAATVATAVELPLVSQLLLLAQWIPLKGRLQMLGHSK